MPRRSAIPALVLAALALAARPVPADDLTYDPVVDGAIVLGGGALWLVSETLLKDELAPDACRWCEPGGLDASVRDALVWSDRRTADAASNLTGFVLVPAGALGLTALAAGHDDRFSGWGGDALVILEATVLAADLDQAVKFAAGRERPFVHALPAHKKGDTAHRSDNNLSFYSGHTTSAFAFAVSSGTVASLRDYRWAPVVWAAGLPLAATTGYLRIAADKHYLTDVLAGMAVGSLIGFAVPYLWHRSGDGGAAAETAPAAALSWSGRW